MLPQKICWNALQKFKVKFGILFVVQKKAAVKRIFTSSI